MNQNQRGKDEETCHKTTSKVLFKPSSPQSKEALNGI